MTTTLHTLAEVREIARTLNPDAKNPYYEDFGQCLYADPEDHSVPSCIAGTIIHDLDLEVFAAIADVETSLDEDELAAYLQENLLTPDAFRWLKAAQAKADRVEYEVGEVYDTEARSTWGQAIAIADLTFEDEA